MPQPELPTAADLARFTLAAQHPLTRAWLGDEARLANLADEHAFDMRLATDLDFARQRVEWLELACAPEALLNRWVQVSDDLTAMLSMRYKGGDATQPFVDVSVTTRPVDAGDLEPLSALALEHYGALSPARLRFWSTHGLDEGREAFAPAQPDMRVLAAPLADLRGGTVPDGLELTPTADDRHLADAVAAYAAVDAAHPGHTGQARVLDSDSLAEAIAAGTMFDVVWRGRWSGYAGTLPETQLGLNAQVVQELLLAPHARGHGLGRWLSTLLARHLQGDGRVLSGTIHGDNRGARSAALAAGRQDVGGWWWRALG